MSSIFGIAVSGLNDAVARVANATSNIVNALSTNFHPRDVVTFSNSVGNNNLGVSTFTVPRPQSGATSVIVAAQTQTNSGPVATTAASVTANLPASASVGFTSSPIAIRIFDNLGVVQNLSLTFTKTGLNSFTARITSPNGASINGPSPSLADFDIDVPLTFNDTVNPGTLASVAPGSGYTVTNGQIQFALTYPGAGTQNVTLSFGNLNSSTGLTQFSGTDVTLYGTSQNGNAYGTGGSEPVAVGQAFPPDNGVDLAAEIINLQIAKTAYAANVKVIKTEAELEKSLINIKT